MTFRFLGPDPLEELFRLALVGLQQGKRPRDLEKQSIDFKEERGRRGKSGEVLPGMPRNEQAAAHLAEELACMANTPGAGMVVVGISDEGERIGTNLDPEWLRFRIYELTENKLTVDVREAVLDGVRILVIRAPQAVEPIRYKGKLRWRVADHCVEVDASAWASGRLGSAGLDWSGQRSGHVASDVSPRALEVARKFLTQGGPDQAGSNLAEATDIDLLRRLNVLDADGYLTNAGSLLFVATPVPALDYIRREFPGGDSEQRVIESGSLLAQLDAVESASRLANRIPPHVGTGLVHTQHRALPPRSIREAVVNGVLHRDWQSPAPTTVEHVGDNLTVTSPGGFVGGITAANIITHPSTPRYRHLASVVAHLRLAEREGIGVDRMFADMVRLGHEPPEIKQLPGPFVRVALIGGPASGEWLTFLEQLGREPVRDLDILLLLDMVTRRGWFDWATAGIVLQKGPAETADAVRRLEVIKVGGTPAVVPVAGVPMNTPPAWRLSDLMVGAISRRVGPLRGKAGRSGLLLDWAFKRGRVSSTEAADLLGVSIGYAGNILGVLEQEGVLQAGRSERRGRGFFYIPSNHECGA